MAHFSSSTKSTKAQTCFDMAIFGGRVYAGLVFSGVEGIVDLTGLYKMIGPKNKEKR